MPRNLRGDDANSPKHLPQCIAFFHSEEDGNGAT
jgi:hypothetical protein